MVDVLGRVQEISREDFEAWSGCRRIFVHDYARKFGVVTLAGGHHAVAMSWRSDMVVPVVVVENEFRTWIGVDQRVACVNGDGMVLLSVCLLTPLLDIKCFQFCSVVLCEAEAILFNPNCSIREVVGLPDIPCDVYEGGEGIFVVFDDGRRERIA